MGKGTKRFFDSERRTRTSFDNLLKQRFENATYIRYIHLPFPPNFRTIQRAQKWLVKPDIVLQDVERCSGQGPFSYSHRLLLVGRYVADVQSG